MLAITQAYLNLTTMNSYDTAYSAITASRRNQDLAFGSTRNMSMPLRDVFQSEKDLMVKREQNSLLYRVALIWDNSLQKLQKKNIKDTFDTFA